MKTESNHHLMTTGIEYSRKSSSALAQYGFTLVEIVLTIVVLSIGVAGILSVMIQATTSSGDPMQRQQAINIAQAYMEEILARPYYDPSLGDVTPPTAPCTVPTAGRANFNDICDYNGLDDTNPEDINGDSILSGGNPLPYRVQVAVTTADLGNPALFASNNEAVKITVTVTPPSGVPVSITSYRTAVF